MLFDSAIDLIFTGIGAFLVGVGSALSGAAAWRRRNNGGGK